MRSHILDKRLGPFENLVSNPRLKRCVSGSTVFKRNLATNPIFARAVSGTDVVRRNLAVNPKLSADASLWSAFGTNASTAYSTRVAVTTPEAGISWAYERSGFGMQSASRVVYQIDGLTVGATYSVSALIRTVLTDGASSAQLIVATSASAGTGNLHIYGISTGGVYSRTSGVFVAQASTMYLQLRKAGPTSELQNTIGMTGILVEQRPSPLPYFDGDTPDALGFTYEWEGTAGGSTSVIKTASVEVRRNFINTPTIGNWGAPGAASVASGAALPEMINGKTTGVRAVSASTGQTFINNNGSANLVTPGDVISIAACGGSDDNATARIRFGFFDIDNNLVGTFLFGAHTAVSAGSMVELVAEGITVPATAYRLNLGIEFSSIQTGTAVYVTAAFAEKSPTYQGYFDGSMTPDADLMPAWTGVAEGSVSILRGVRVSNVYGIGSSTNNAYAILSWVDGLMRLIAGGISNGSVASVGGALGSFAGYGVTFIPGRTYTALVDVVVKTSLSGTLHPDAISISALWPDGLGGYTRTTSQAPNIVGTHTVRIQFTIPASTTGIQLRLYNGAYAGNGDVYFTNLAIIEGGAYSGPIFHGDTDPDDTGIVYEWEGTEHDSASVMKVGIVEVRRNLATSPFGLGPMDGYNGAETVTPGVAVNDHPEGITTATRVSYTAGLGNVGAITTHGTYPVNDTSATYALSAWVKVESGDTGTFALALIGQATGGPVVNPAAGEWHKLTWMVTPTTSRRTGVRLGGVTTQSGSFLITGLVVEKIAANLPEFDGYHSPDGDLMATWVGTPNDSESVLYGINVETVGSLNRCKAYKPLDREGLKLVVDTVGYIPRVGIPYTFLDGGRGRTFTVIGTYESSTSFKGQIRAQFDGVTVEQSGLIDSGTTYRWVITVPDDPAITRWRPEFGIQSNVDIGVSAIWKDLMVVEGIYDGPYFDGDDDRVVWRSTPHASPSVGYPALTT